MEIYEHKKIEEKWQKDWEKNKVYHATDGSKKPKKYVLIEFPYPSGEGLHMGHLRPYMAGDVYSRFNRMNGFETMFPMGWDAFGLPAENYALKKGVHPSITVAQNVANAKAQVISWGVGFDWDREVNTTDPNYYKWTQWIFLQFFKAGLAYEATGLINWCPKDKTGLANEEVIDGKCERCGTVVEKKEMKQWYLKITDYAEKLLDGLKELDWPEAVKIQQANWIGKSEGAEIGFSLDDSIKHIIILHGRNGSPDNYVFPWLKKELEKKGYTVEVPKLPNTGEPNDEEQADFVQKNCRFDKNTAIIAQSFGGIVAMRLLERGIKVQRVVLACVPFSGKFNDNKIRKSVTEACQKGFDFEKIIKNSETFTVLRDERDEIVPREDAELWQKNLKATLLKGYGNVPHFSGEQEPDMLKSIAPVLTVFTTRPDTLFGATYMVLAPEHPLVSQITTSEQKKNVDAYVNTAKSKTEADRTNLEKEKTGVFTGAYAINPGTKEKIPVWVADYVLGNYGTGAIMAVPAHDERDFEFAKKYKLPIREVVKPPKVLSQAIDDISPAPAGIWGQLQKLDIESDCWTGDGTLINSGEFDGQDTEKARSKIAKKFGEVKIQYRLRDWVFSRQRYWGEPIPIIHCEKCGTVPVPEEDLPVKLPQVEKYEPTGTGESPLAGIDSWVNVKCPKCEGKAKRETNTMPQWAGSSWYWLRYTDSKNEKEMASKKLLKYWTPVDVYFGGIEHTTLHLLYSRFWNLFLFDQGHVTAKEPYLKRVPHGIILGPDGEKMSKSRGNVINPDDLVQNYGADALRMFELFAGPHEGTVTLKSETIVGIKRFLDRVWRYQQVFEEGEDNKQIHKLIKKITFDIEHFKFNTAVASFMEFLNENKQMSKANWEDFLKLLAPFAPHISEELWHQLKHKDSIHLQPWPRFDEKFAKDDKVIVVVQVLGRVRASLEMPAGASKEEVKVKALADDNVRKHLAGKQVVKEVFVADKLINFVVKE